MSGSGRDLGIRITASNTATASINELKASVKSLETTLTELGLRAANSSAISAASIQKEIVAIREKIAAINAEITARGAQTAAIMAAGRAAGAAAAAGADAARAAIVGAEAATAAFAKQETAALAAAAASRAATVAGASSAEASVAAAAASAAVFRQRATARAAMGAEGAAAGVGGAEASILGAGAGAILTKESRHVVGMFDSLARGQRGQFISSIGAAARDAGLGVAGLSASIGGLVAIMGGAALIRGAENIGKWATETRAAASAAGMSVSQYSGLQGALTLTGLKASEADSILSRFAVNLATATADGSSKAAEGYHHLGISQEELVSNAGNVHAMLLRLADAFTSAENSANRDAAVNEIAGRGFRELIKVIQAGGPALKDLEDKAKSLGITLTDETAASAEKAGNEIRMLGSVLRGEFDQALIESMPNIVAVAKVLNTVVNVLYDVIAAAPRAAAAIISVGSSWQSSGFMSMEGGLAAPGRGLGAVGAPSTSFSTAAKTPEISGLMPGEVTGGAIAGRYVPPPASKGASGADTSTEAAMRNAMVTDALAAEEVAKKVGASREQISMKGTQAEIADMQKVLNAHTLNALDQTRIDTEMKEKQRSLLMQGVSSSSSAAKQDYANFASAEKLKISEAQGSSAKIKAIYDEWLSAAEGRYRQSAAVIVGIEREKVQAINAARLSELKEREKSEDDQARLTALNIRMAQITSGATVGERAKGPSADIQQAQQDRTEAAQIEATAQQRIAARQQELTTSISGSNEQKQLQQEIVDIRTRSTEQEVALMQKAADLVADANRKIAASFVNLFDQVGNQMEKFSDSLVKALIAPQIDILKVGLTSEKVSMQGNEIRAAFSSMIVGAVSSAGKAVEGAIGHVLANALSGGASNTVGELLGNWLGKAVSSIFPSLTGIGTTAIGTATTTAAVTAGSASIVAAITASTTAIVGAITVGHPSVAGFSFSSGGIVPSAASGMVVGGTGGTLAILHAREMVLPAPISTGIQQMIQRGGTNTSSSHNNANLSYSPTINAPRGRGGYGMTRAEFAQMLSLNSGAMLGEARNMMRAGWRPG